MSSHTALSGLTTLGLLLTGKQYTDCTAFCPVCSYPPGAAPFSLLTRILLLYTQRFHIFSFERNCSWFQQWWFWLLLTCMSNLYCNCFFSGFINKHFLWSQKYLPRKLRGKGNWFLFSMWIREGLKVVFWNCMLEKVREALQADGAPVASMKYRFQISFQLLQLTSRNSLFQMMKF